MRIFKNRDKWNFTGIDEENEYIFIINRYTIIYIRIYRNIILSFFFDYRCLFFSHTSNHHTPCTFILSKNAQQKYAKIPVEVFTKSCRS